MLPFGLPRTWVRLFRRARGGLWLWLLLGVWALPAAAVNLPATGWVVTDPTGEWTPTQARAALHGPQAQPHDPQRTLPLGPGKAVWLWLERPRAMEQQQTLLMLDYAGLDEMVVHFPSPHVPPEAWSSLRTGDRHPVADWPLPHFAPVLPLGSEARHGLLVRVEHSHPVSLPLSFITGHELLRQSRFQLLLIGGYFGLVTLVLLFSGFNAWWLRDAAYGLYGLYVLVLALAQASLTGLGGLYLWPDHAWWNDRATLVLPMISATLASWFVARVAHPLPGRWVSGLLHAHAAAGLMLALLFLTVGRQPFFGVAHLYFLLTLPVFIGVLGWDAARRGPSGWWLVAGFACLLAGASLQALRNLGVLPMSDITQHSAQVGAALEVPLLFIGLYLRSRLQRDLSVRTAVLQQQDPTTGLLNDRVTRERLEHALQRTRSRPGAVAILRLRLVNQDDIIRDRGVQGFTAGLVLFGSSLQGLARPGDTVGRLEQGDFVYVCEKTLDEAQARLLATRIVAMGLRQSVTVPLRFHVAICLHGHEWPGATELLFALGRTLGSPPGDGATPSSSIRLLSSRWGEARTAGLPPPPPAPL